MIKIFLHEHKSFAKQLSMNFVNLFIPLVAKRLKEKSDHAYCSFPKNLEHVLLEFLLRSLTVPFCVPFAFL